VLIGSAVAAAPLPNPGTIGAATDVPQASQAGGQQRINLGQRLADGTLRVVNREVTRLPAPGDGVRVSEKAAVGVVWIEGSDFAEGTIEIDVRGRDVPQQSFVGVAFHRKDDDTYESVYVRPFNFRTEDPVRHRHAVQYMASPDYDWPRLRQEFPDKFESSVDPAIAPTDWVPLRIVVKGQTIQVYVGRVVSPTLEVRKLGQQDRGMIGLWTGNNSNGDFANLRITPMK
jgi:hypothetical protein